MGNNDELGMLFWNEEPGDGSGLPALLIFSFLENSQANFPTNVLKQPQHYKAPKAPAFAFGFSAMIKFFLQSKKRLIFYLFIFLKRSMQEIGQTLQHPEHFPQDKLKMQQGGSKA